MNRLAVVALGGNAILRTGQTGTIEEQEANTFETLEHLLFLLRCGFNLIVTHGNGPQVGNMLLRNQAGEKLHGVAPMPLDVCVAETQGEIGYMIERMFRNVLAKYSLRRDILTVVTQVVIDPEDEAFTHPIKRIGPLYTPDEAQMLATVHGWTFAPSHKVEGKMQRTVPSPRPLDVFNYETMGQTARSGAVVIAAGGGGIPVYFDEQGMVRTVDAVVDKDLASALLATRVGAEELYILTDVPYVYIDYKSPSQRRVEALNVKDARHFLASGQFGEGDMAPKVDAAVRFVESGGQRAVITEANRLDNPSFGTRITAEYD